MPSTSHNAVPTTSPTASSATHSSETIELLEEVLRVEKRKVETGRVRVSLVTSTEQRAVHETLTSRRVNVERVAVGRRLEAGEAIPETRTEGDVVVVPVVEEILVLEKRLVVIEELHIRVVHEHQAVEHSVPLRRQQAVVERIVPGATG